MAARTGMGSLIVDLRGMTNAGTADYTVGGVTYWTDDQLQQILDSRRLDIYAEPLRSVFVLADGGSALYFDYFFDGKHTERAESGTVAWELETTAGSIIGTALYTVEHEARKIRFAADQKGTAYQLNYRNYNIYAAASMVLRQKAGQSASRFDVKIDNHSLKLGQLMRNYLVMASAWDIVNGSTSYERVRTDVKSNADI